MSITKSTQLKFQFPRNYRNSKKIIRISLTLIENNTRILCTEIYSPKKSLLELHLPWPAQYSRKEFLEDRKQRRQKAKLIFFEKQMH